jgi:TPR repeat protein
LFLKCSSLGSNQKNDILNTIEEDDTLINQMNEKQLYTLGMHFFEGFLKTRYVTATVYDHDQGNSYQHIIIEKNYTKAYKYLKKAAVKNYPPTLHQLGIMYHRGYGIEQDIAQGEQYFNNAVDIDPNYMNSIAMLYHAHDGMQDFVKALQWYRRLEKRLDEELADSDREKTNEPVQVGLGLLYEYGGGVEQGYQKALGCYQDLIDNNMAAGFHRLGLVYYYGKGVLVDHREALSLFEKATHGKIMVNNKLPFVYSQTYLHQYDTQSNLVFCTVTNRRLQGEPFYYLGIMHRNGQGVPQDEEKAQGYFREALKHQCKRAKYEIRD